MEDLRAEDISYMIQAFTNIAAERETIADKTKIGKFVPKLLLYTINEVYRYNMSDIVTMMSGYFKLWEVGVLGKSELVNMHKIC